MTICTQVSSGEQLESVHLQRQRAQAAYDLIDYYMQFSRDDTSRLDSLKKEGKEGRRQVAVLLRRLATLAKEIDLPTADKVGSAFTEHGPLIKVSVDKRKYRQVL
jgi:exocyst complex component 5